MEYAAHECFKLCYNLYLSMKQKKHLHFFAFWWYKPGDSNMLIKNFLRFMREKKCSYIYIFYYLK